MFKQVGAEGKRSSNTSPQVCQALRIEVKGEMGDMEGLSVAVDE